jgi:alpha-galactosidase
VWAKPIEHGDYAVAFFNRGEKQAEVSLKWADLHLGEKAKARDLWTHENLGSIPYGFVARVAPHGVVMLKVWK